MQGQCWICSKCNNDHSPGKDCHGKPLEVVTAFAWAERAKGSRLLRLVVAGIVVGWDDSQCDNTGIFDKKIAHINEEHLKGIKKGREYLERDNQELARFTETIKKEKDIAVEALIRLRDCDWTIGRGDRMDPVREIAREALKQIQINP